MRILCINANYPGRLGLLAGYLAEQGHDILFAACHSRKGFSLPHVRRVLLKSGDQKVTSTQEPCVRHWQQLFSVASAAIAPLRILNSEFQPQMVLSTPAEGASFFVSNIFPQAFHAFYVLLNKGMYGPALQTQAPVQSLRILYSHKAFIFSEYEKRFLPPRLWPLLECTDPWLDTAQMDPALANPFAPPGCGESGEWVCFRLQELGAEHYALCCRLALELLQLRPHCHVLLDCEDRGGEKAAWITRLPAALRTRLHMRGRQNSAMRRDMLRNAWVYVVPGAASETRLARLEAMGCGALLMASPKADTTEAPQRVSHKERMARHMAAPDEEAFWQHDLAAPDLLKAPPVLAAALELPGRNMLAFPAANPQKQVGAIIDALEHQREYAALRRRARESVCARFSPQQVLPRHVARLMECYQHFLTHR